MKARRGNYRSGGSTEFSLPLILFLIALLLGACDRQQPGTANPAEPAAPKEKAAGRLDRSFAGTTAPGIAFEAPGGKRASFSQFRGKPLLVNLWATWCAPCIAEMPTLDALAASRENVRVLALSQDFGGREKVNVFFQQRKFKKLEPYLDPELAMMSELKVQTLPTTILYDARGREVWRLTGMEDWTGARAKGLIAEAMKP